MACRPSSSPLGHDDHQAVDDNNGPLACSTVANPSCCVDRNDADRTEKMKVFGFYGLGTMGRHFAAHLNAYSMNLQQTQSLIASRNPSKALSLQREIGAHYRENFDALAAECDILALCLSTSADVASVIRGAPRFKEGALVIDVSSGEPRLTQELGAELERRGVRLVDAPVSGGPSGAKSGTCVTMLGGMAADLDEAEEVVGCWSSKIVRCGPLGSGDAVKAINNVASSVELEFDGGPSVAERRCRRS